MDEALLTAQRMQLLAAQILALVHKDVDMFDFLAAIGCVLTALVASQVEPEERMKFATTWSETFLKSVRDTLQ